MIYGYARVSTAFEQTKDRNQTFDRQKMILKEHGVKPENIFCDRITGGSRTKDREAFDRLMKIVIPGDIIIVSEMSRFSRSLVDLFHSIDNLMQRQIGIEFIKENLKIGTNGLDPFNKFMFSVLGAVNEFEKNIIAERVHEGMQASKAKGTKLGRPTKVTPEMEKEMVQKWIYEGYNYEMLKKHFKLSMPTISTIMRKYAREKKEYELKLKKASKE